MITDIELYRGYSSNQDLLVTIVSYNDSVLDFITKLNDTLESCKKISNSIKRHELNTIIFNLIQRMNNYPDENVKVNSLFFISNEQNIFYQYEFNNNELNTLREYNIFNFQYRNTEKFPIDEFIDIFTNFVFINSMQMNRMELRLWQMNQYKSKELVNIKSINENQLMDLITKTRIQKDDKIIIYGQSPLLTSQKIQENNKNIIVNKNLTKDEVWSVYKDELMRDNLVILQERMSKINDEKHMNLYVFGRIKIEIKEHIENYLLKELFIEERKLKILENDLPKECFNFKIYPIRSLTPNDIGDQFIRDYNGLMGIKYF